MLVATIAISRSSIRSAVLQNVVGPVPHASCRADPVAFGWRSGRAAVFAYDAAGHSAQPAAPPVEAPLLAEARATGEVAYRSRGGDFVSVVPTRGSGPCAYIRVQFPDLVMQAAPAVAGVLALALFLGMSLATLFTLGLVVRPLQRRIDALATAAEGVGSDAYRPEKARADGLGRIARVLTESHTRVAATQEALEARHRELEEHLSGIAHDLRTPLSSMQLALEGLAADAEGPLRQEAHRALADVVYLGALVENL
ncbi:MAG: histidine kinase dimerization/phospho-acceptor domain-containing protein, partial [Myxococcota bacterium]